MVSHPDKDGEKFHMAGMARLVVAEPSDTPESIRFRVVKYGSKEYSHAAPEPTLPPEIETKTGSQELVSKLAKHFGLMPVVVADVLSELISSGSYSSQDELQEEAIIKLSGMCNPTSTPIEANETELQHRESKRQKL
jgi:hypothetical protein